MKPILQALLLADRVYQEVSGKTIIAGVFNQMRFKPTVEVEQPTKDNPRTLPIADVQDPGNPWVYVSLTDVKGEIPLELRYESLSGDKVFFRAELLVKCDDPVRTVELRLPVPMLPHVAGLFVLDLLYKGESLGSHRVECVEVSDVSA